MQATNYQNITFMVKIFEGSNFQTFQGYFFQTFYPC